MKKISKYKTLENKIADFINNNAERIALGSSLLYGLNNNYLFIPFIIIPPLIRNLKIKEKEYIIRNPPDYINQEEIHKLTEEYFNLKEREGENFIIPALAAYGIGSLIKNAIEYFLK